MDKPNKIHPPSITRITGVHFNYYQVCHRKLWLMSSGITMEHNSDLVLEGKLIHASAYTQRPDRYEELEIDGIKVDFYDPLNKVVHEIKKSNVISQAHRLQLLYYLYVLDRNGIHGVTGILEYPILRRREEVFLADADKRYIEETEQKIRQIIHQKECPQKINSKICKKCSYYEFCFSGEEL